jgi:8-oxo-dGTP diphosphatase
MVNNNVSKPLKKSVSIIVRNENDEFLVVKRPKDPNDRLAGVWGFPAATLRSDEADSML